MTLTKIKCIPLVLSLNSNSPSSEQATPSWSTRRSTVWAKSVIARSSGNVTRGGTVGAFCCREVGGRTNGRNSVVSCRRDFNSVDKGCTDSVKDCKTSGLGETVHQPLFISRAAKTENPVPRSFFAPKPNGNARYAGYFGVL